MFFQPRLGAPQAMREIIAKSQKHFFFLWCLEFLCCDFKYCSFSLIISLYVSPSLECQERDGPIVFDTNKMNHQLCLFYFYVVVKRQIRSMGFRISWREKFEHLFSGMSLPLFFFFLISQLTVSGLSCSTQDLSFVMQDPLCSAGSRMFRLSSCGRQALLLAHGTLLPQPGIGRWILSPWATREVLCLHF